MLNRLENCGAKLLRLRPFGPSIYRYLKLYVTFPVTMTNLQTKQTMTLPGIPLQHQPDRLKEFQTLIRHVYQEPTQMRRALRLAFKELPPAEAQALRDWVERRFSL